MLRLAHRAKAEGKTAIELVPEVAASEGWNVHGNLHRKLTMTTAHGRTMTLAPRSKRRHSRGTVPPVPVHRAGSASARARRRAATGRNPTQTR